MTVTATEIVLPGVVEPSGLQVRTRELPAPGPGQVVLRVEATGVSFAEQQMRLGRYYNQPPFPFVPGYDAVGTVTATGPGVEAGLAGRRFAVVTKVGAWASHLVADAAALVAVPDGLDPADAETVVVNGVTAYQMLFRVAKVRAGQTIVVLGANGGVGSTLVQLARHAGITVVGTASARHHALVERLGATPVDYRDPDLYVRILGLAPGGVDAVFDHVGGDGLKQSWHLVRKGGTLVSYGTAADKDSPGSPQMTFLNLFSQLWMWHLSPNNRSARFYNFWAAAFKKRHNEDLAAVFKLLTEGVLTPQVAARFPLSQAAEALALAESRTVAGKVILTGEPT
ncbi:medium chain dehydrogenase/reductase family protein [Actinoplanes sp. TRM 88003]|uniref:Medium chain dehydrogenase/reductase family protein n=1 Tax=Paractinoplanes aksuensis TaxID=2939490 RepID=A0ABT1DUL8_9ACTN|nr:medium chain dehydrogenase/reductase family protein [Actinoplanes aksuensis]MCO8273655.1 medium chain dehydrogenase/reductase family protein [Actinoplanes aksuensis]